jgi:hypothetical protein
LGVSLTFAKLCSLPFFNFSTLNMKTLALLFSAGLVSAGANVAARQAGAAFVNSSDGSNVVVNNGQGFNGANFNLADLGLSGLNINGLDLGSIDLGNQNSVAEAILAMLGGLCLGNALSLDSILGFGLNNDVDLFFQLASLMQLEQLGFLDLGGINSLFSSGTVLGGFNLGGLPLFSSPLAPPTTDRSRQAFSRGKSKRPRRP